MDITLSNCILSCTHVGVTIFLWGEIPGGNSGTDRTFPNFPASALVFVGARLN